MNRNLIHDSCLNILKPDAYANNPNVIFSVVNRVHLYRFEIDLHNVKESKKEKVKSCDTAAIKSVRDPYYIIVDYHQISKDIMLSLKHLSI